MLPKVAHTHLIECIQAIVRGCASLEHNTTDQSTRLGRTVQRTNGTDVILVSFLVDVSVVGNGAFAEVLLVVAFVLICIVVVDTQNPTHSVSSQ